MGRIKKKPRRSVRFFENGSTSNYGENTANPGASLANDLKVDDFGNIQNPPLFFDVDKSSWDSLEHRDLSEIVLHNLNYSPEFIGFELNEEICLRVRLCDVNERVVRIKSGYWPVFSSENIYLEFISRRVVNNIEACDVVVCGQFDGSDDGITGLVQLVSMKFLTLRPVFGVRLCEDVCSLRIRVEILQDAFSACTSLLDNTRLAWKKSMMSVMAWLRPELTTSEARYGVHVSSEIEEDLNSEVDDGSFKDSNFDVGGFYEAIKRSKDCPMLDAELPDLLPELRPYQRRAACWMVQRERGALQDSVAWENNFYCPPMCVVVDFLESPSKMFYNPFSGNVSLCQEIAPSYVFGGILADEMGMGKTVELLACILAHRKSSSEQGYCFRGITDITEKEKTRINRLKRERVECVCGALSESYKYEGLWVQCDVCDAWQHADCVGYSPSEGIQRTKETSKGKRNSNRRKKNVADIVIMNNEYVCQICLQLMQATSSPIESAATLIICPSSILPQWHAEILRHTNPGSMRTYVYEGVKEKSSSNSTALDINELVSADIVLTTYDVLRDDLSHDSERHEGDRRLMRYGKRYPVIPTLLTRVLWWRICLDEAQMVESSVVAAAEMALRLHARHRWCITGTPIQRKLDDLYGLLKFLKASPFDVSRWWAEVIREPYERKNVAAMAFTHQIFRQLMWRSSKAHVADELELPPQEEQVSWLSFSAVEEHFYQRQHETCVDFAREVLERFKSQSLSKHCSASSSSVPDPFVTHLEATKLLNSLLKLRQACCHPQVGGSGLRSLQLSPMTMDEILSVLISKTKLEGEDALRKVVSSLNGLAGIAIIQGELSNAASFYKEALNLAEEHSEDFRVDPLLNIHIHQNLAEVLKSASNTLQLVSFCGGQLTGKIEEMPSQISVGITACLEHIKKTQNVTEDILDRPRDTSVLNCNSSKNGSEGVKKSSIESLIIICEGLKQKYLSGFYSRLSQAQQEFQKSYMQVDDSINNRENKNRVWWLEALQQIEQNRDSANELSRRIENAILDSQNITKSARIDSRFRSIDALKYSIQSGLDSLEAARKRLLDQLLEIDQTMEKPRDEDVDRVRYCPNCYMNVDGPLCAHCELEELFQAYEARLFIRKEDNGGFISSAEAVDLKKKRLERNHFYWNLEQKSNIDASSGPNNLGRSKRDSAKMFMDSKLPSELEIILGFIRTYFRAHFGREGIAAASRHLVLLEEMKKEYAHARSLATAQAQVLRAYDEIKMATSRLRLKESGDDDNSIDALSLEELEVANVENSSEKFVSLATLSRIRGKLRFLQGLVVSKQKEESDNEVAALTDTPSPESAKSTRLVEEMCPVCQEILQNQKMVFQCGHLTCCKCFCTITERKMVSYSKMDDNWVLCPTCRQPSDFESIALADDGQSKSSVVKSENLVASVSVQGSYSTKIEAITRKILWIKSSDPVAKVLVFSSWNDVLDVLEHAFASNEISYVRMKGGRKQSQAALSIFKGEKMTEKGCVEINDQRKPDSKFIQVLLLLIQQGANGLNLLEAQHVILVEPLLNPAVEAQAISRVHRIGQTRKTIVHRFLIKDTVEESIYKLNKSRNSSSFISGNKKNQDQPVLTLKDVESLFAVTPPAAPDKSNEHSSSSLMHLPPSVAAAIAAEKRLGQSTM
ncbi:E3 ubiquitin-protein ligase SHPRH-like isoform X1 [Chenopodium quinoa]|uniref:E3 ubiquitin-protein ligase SHPRH-like isoform X1 n=1 Tax=Chenopodium quinoa TaxID=63459 RepID=UPI000B78804E|nr:E3 ubiquitin-protein ligase SHPRH-like isoform X1 [Chenopodium quinoa]